VTVAYFIKNYKCIGEKICLLGKKTVLSKLLKMQCVPKQVVDVLPILAGAILTFLHFMYSVFEILQKYFSLIKSMWLQRTTWRHFKYEAEEVAFVISAVKELQKVPKHLVLLLGTETLSVKDVVNIVKWSLAAGIPFLSFHDHQGE